MTPYRHETPGHDRAVAPAVPAQQPLAQDADVVRDADGLVVDEYSDADFVSAEHMDALDQAISIDSTDVLDDAAREGDGITEIKPAEAMKNDGADADMLLGAESLSVDELEDAAIGHELTGPASVTRDDEVHGERMFDSPDGKGRQTPDDE
jgi:hypothetical protein